MNEQLGEHLASLSAKLGTTVEHLYGALLRQALFAGVWDLATALLTLVAIWVGFLIWVKKRRPWKFLGASAWIHLRSSSSRWSLWH